MHTLKENGKLQTLLKQPLALNYLMADDRHQVLLACLSFQWTMTLV